MASQTRLQTHANSSASIEPALPTFMDHLNELKNRFFWVGLAFMAAAGSAYPFFDSIIKLLMRPLGDEQLYYLTPAGGFSFAIKICMYLGIIGVLPVLVYQIYKFVSPVVEKRNTRKALGYLCISTILAAIGIVFAYIVSLPAAVQFLTSFGMDKVSAMLTVDSYLSFIIAYLLAGALLFQMPLIMLIVNAIKPLQPRKLMSYQRHMVVGAFVVAAIISPTPDVVNQSLLAGPMVAMYQLGILVIWLKARRSSPKKIRSRTISQRSSRSRISPYIAHEPKFHLAAVEQLAQFSSRTPLSAATHTSATQSTTMATKSAVSRYPALHNSAAPTVKVQQVGQPPVIRDTSVSSPNTMTDAPRMPRYRQMARVDRSKLAVGNRSYRVPQSAAGQVRRFGVDGFSTQVV